MYQKLFVSLNQQTPDLLEELMSDVASLLVSLRQKSWTICLRMGRFGYLCAD